MTRQEALDIYRRHGLLLAQFGVREDVAARLRELGQAHDAAREEQERQRYRLATIVDEAFGPQEVLPTDALLTRLERGLFEIRMALGKAEAARDEWARQCAMASEHQSDGLNEAARLRGALVKVEDELHCYFAADGAHTRDFRLRRADEVIRAALEAEQASALDGRACDQCGEKAWPEWQDERCPNHANPHGSCDGKLERR